MTEPQVWTLIGVFAGALFAVLGVITSMFTRIIRAEVGGLRAAMDARFEGMQQSMDARFEGMQQSMDARFATMDARFDSVNTRIDGLDRDIRMLVKQAFPDA